jgi:hypothetical protein
LPTCERPNAFSDMCRRRQRNCRAGSFIRLKTDCRSLAHCCEQTAQTHRRIAASVLNQPPLATARTPRVDRGLGLAQVWRRGGPALSMAPA